MFSNTIILFPIENKISIFTWTIAFSNTMYLSFMLTKNKGVRHTLSKSIEIWLQGAGIATELRLDRLWQLIQTKVTTTAYVSFFNSCPSYLWQRFQLILCLSKAILIVSKLKLKLLINLKIWLTHPYSFKAQPKTTKSTPIAPAKDSAMILENKTVETVCNFEYLTISKESKL